ncbi:hypothetical protein JCM10207_002001 [Rhodosporidiobolus poonsookiae]
MSHLQYFNYPGVGERNVTTYGYSQTVRIGDRIEASGQGGWNPDNGSFDGLKEINAQIDQAFKNVELALKNAGGKGWEEVYRVNSYHVPINDEASAAMTRNFLQYMPNHKPVWTAVGVTRLAEDDMRVEIEVAAHLSEAK